MKSLFIGLLLALGMAWNPAQADAAKRESAFAEYAKPLRFATASHVLELRLQALVATPRADVEDDDRDSAEGEDEDEGPPIPLLALFAGSLGQSDPALLQTLEDDLDNVQRLAGDDDGNALAQAVRRAQEDLALTRKALVPDALAADPAFRAALIAKLVNSERGLGEGYEEAATGEVSAYPLAWLTLQRVNALWRELAPALPDAADGVGLALDQLNGLMPSIQPPATFTDPEDVEGAALDLVFALEGALQQPILVRGVAPALALMQRQIQDTCDAAQADKPRLVLENALAARITYGAHLASTVTMLAPQAHEELQALWGDLERIRGDDGAAVCAALQGAVKQLAVTFG